MSQEVLYHLWVVRGEIVLDSAFHVGSGQASRYSDQALRRDGQGRPYLPGSSLAGLLRTAAEDLAGDVLGVPACSDRTGDINCPTCMLFGWASPKGDRRAGVASRLYVEDAYPARLIPDQREVRDHVGINRLRGAAEPNLRFTQEVAPCNSRFGFEISLEDATPRDLRLILAVLDLWQAIGFQLGGRTTTGLGLARLESLQFYGLNFNNDKILRDWLFADAHQLPDSSGLTRQELDKELADNLGSNISWPERDQPEHFLPQHLILNVALEFNEPVLVVGAALGLNESDADFIKTTIADGQEVHVIPGSGLKGVLRTRVGKIIRTLDFYNGYAKSDAAHDDLHTADSTYRKRIHACSVTQGKIGETWEKLEACFGTSAKQRSVEDQEMDGEKLYAQSCVLCRLFGNSMMRGRLTVGEGQLAAGVKPKEKTFDHVAIDRFTGGASDAKKFDTRPILPENAYTLFTFQLRLERPEPWMLSLLGLVLKDLQDGDIRIGHATHRGYGKVRGRVTTGYALLLPDSQLDKLFTQFELLATEAPTPFRKYNFRLPDKDDGSGVAQLFVECHGKFLDEIDYPRPKKGGDT
jgi:CRISPR/Cas system CSM-associated protein Csm3 (group 7 of RAMP superfamily)